MANLTLSRCLDAGHVRLAELAFELLAAQDRGNEAEVARLVETMLHLRLGLEDAARLPAGSAEQDAVLAYYCETYGLALALTDPLLRPLLPAIPAEGAKVRPRVLVVNGKLLVVNGKLLVMGGTLVSPSPATEPTA